MSITLLASSAAEIDACESCLITCHAAGCVPPCFVGDCPTGADLFEVLDRAAWGIYGRQDPDRAVELCSVD